MPLVVQAAVTAVEPVCRGHLIHTIIALSAISIRIPVEIVHQSLIHAPAPSSTQPAPAADLTGLFCAFMAQPSSRSSRETVTGHMRGNAPDEWEHPGEVLVELGYHAVGVAMMN
jgi:hypothetical protein